MLTIKTGYECTPLSVALQRVPIEESKNYDKHNQDVGAEIFKWMYSRVPHDVWDGFFLQGMKTPGVVHRAARKARTTIRGEQNQSDQ